MKAPAAKRNVLVLLAGFLWTTVGVALIAAGWHWEIVFSGNLIIAIITALIIGAAIYRFGFSKLAGKNLSRIFAQAPGKEKVCVFAFQDKRSYFIVALMMAMGYGLRHSPLPKTYLAPFYMAIGLALLLSSLIYYRSLCRN